MLFKFKNFFFWQKLNYKQVNYNTNNKNKIPNINYYSQKNLEKFNLKGDYEELLKIYKNEPKKIHNFWMSVETEDIYTPIYLDFYIGFENLIDKGFTLIQITSTNKFDIIFSKDDIKFIKAKCLKRKKDPINKIYTENIGIIKNNLYLDLIQIDKLIGMEFFLFVPHLNKNKNFYYTIIVGLQNLNFSELNNINFNLLNNVNFTKLTSLNFNYNFFKNLLNLNKTIFNETYLSGKYKKFFLKTLLKRIWQLRKMIK